MPKLANGQRKLLEQATAFYQQSLKEALPFLECRGLDEAVARKYRLGVVSRPCSGHESYVSRLSIPYLSRSGCVTIRFRCLEEHNCKIAQGPKYLSMRGDKPTLYNTEALFAAGSVIAITEGELDALVITEYAGVLAHHFAAQISCMGLSGYMFRPHPRLVAAPAESAFGVTTFAVGMRQ